MEQKPEISPEFQELYDSVDKMCADLAYAVLKHVEKNDSRLLKKIRIRLENTINDINEIK